MRNIDEMSPNEVKVWAVGHIDDIKLKSSIEYYLGIQLTGNLIIGTPFKNGDSWSVPVKFTHDFSIDRPFLAIFEKATLEDFGSWFACDETGENIRWTFHLHMMYKNFNGGSNGVPFLRVTVTENETTIIWEGNK